MTKPLVIDYYTDILCVWAWVAQRRIDELNQALGSQIEFQYYYVDVFGDVSTKMDTHWKPKGGYAGFAQHVNQSASVFENALTNSKIWSEVRPSTSANAHLMLKAIELAHDKRISIDMALNFRKAFFIDALDISDLEVLFSLAESNDLALPLIKSKLQDGGAIVALMQDYQLSKSQNLKGSPSYVIDNGRQTLYGNVGYRVLLANVKELLRNPVDEASSC